MSGSETSTEAAQRRDRGSMLQGGLIMLVLVVLLSWLPVLGPLVAGFAGGRVVGTPKRALVTGLIPAVVLAGLMVVVLALFELPVVGAVAGVTVFVIVAIQEIPLLLGAYAGGALAEG